MRIFSHCRVQCAYTVYPSRFEIKILTDCSGDIHWPIARVPIGIFERTIPDSSVDSRRIQYHEIQYNIFIRH